MPLDPALVTAFRRDGHVTVRGLLSASEVAAVRPAIAAVVDEVAAAGDPQGRIDDYGALFTQVTNAWRRSERVRSFVFDPRFARVAAELMGVDGVRLYHDQALFKEPGGRPHALAPGPVLLAVRHRATRSRCGCRSCDLPDGGRVDARSPPAATASATSRASRSATSPIARSPCASRSGP